MSVTQHGAEPCGAPFESFEDCERFAWSGQIGAADSLFTDCDIPSDVHAIAVPRTAPITQ